MILKLRLVDKEKNNNCHGWVYADKVKQVFRKLNDIKDNGDDWTNVLTVIYENGKDEQFLIYDVAYLLNDEGKTVDTFYHEEEKQRSQSVAEIALDKERVYKSIMKEKEEEEKILVEIMLDGESFGNAVVKSINNKMKV